MKINIPWVFQPFQKQRCVCSWPVMVTFVRYVKRWEVTKSISSVAWQYFKSNVTENENISIDVYFYKWMKNITFSKTGCLILPNFEQKLRHFSSFYSLKVSKNHNGYYFWENRNVKRFISDNVFRRKVILFDIASLSSE